MKLIHWSKNPLTVLHTNYRPAPFLKPQGFWLSDEDDYGWREWCESENFPLGCWQTEFLLKQDHNVLVITAEKELQSFSEEYEISGLFGDSALFKGNEIDWRRVRRTWDGLIITPYQWSCRHDLFWYYGWDCASGVIWNWQSVIRKKSCFTLSTLESQASASVLET